MWIPGASAERRVYFDGKRAVKGAGQRGCCPALLLRRQGEQGVEVPLVRHKLLIGSALAEHSVPQYDDLIVLLHQRRLQPVGDHQAGEAVQVQDGVGDGEGGLIVQGGGGLV